MSNYDTYPNPLDVPGDPTPGPTPSAPADEYAAAYGQSGSSSYDAVPPPSGHQPGGPQPGASYGAPTGGPSTRGPLRGRRLTRRRHDKMVAGVCGGVADHLGIDATIVRLLLVAAVVFGMGAGIVLYIAGWVLMPEA